MIQDDITANNHGTVSFDPDEFLAAIELAMNDPDDVPGEYSFLSEPTSTWIYGWWNYPVEAGKPSLTILGDGVDMSAYGIDITESVPHEDTVGDYIVVRIVANP